MLNRDPKWLTLESTPENEKRWAEAAAEADEARFFALLKVWVKESLKSFGGVFGGFQ